jgi:hypothetical protein
VIVDHDDLVDERASFDQLRANAFDDLSNGGLFVPGRDTHRHRGGAFDSDEFIKVERAGDVGARRGHLSIVGETGLGGKAERELWPIGATRRPVARIGSVRYPLPRFLS